MKQFYEENKHLTYAELKTVMQTTITQASSGIVLYIYI